MLIMGPPDKQGGTFPDVTAAAALNLSAEEPHVGKTSRVLTSLVRASPCSSATAAALRSDMSIE